MHTMLGRNPAPGGAREMDRTKGAGGGGRWMHPPGDRDGGGSPGPGGTSGPGPGSSFPDRGRGRSGVSGAVKRAGRVTGNATPTSISPHRGGKTIRRRNRGSPCARAGPGLRRTFAGALAASIVLLAAGCASAPPKSQENLCEVFHQSPDWYDYARKSAKQWGTPVHVLMAFVRHESSYRARAKPPRKKFLFIPLWRPSSAKGYAQAKNPVWNEYEDERGRFFRSRADMEDALDFIGWYNHKTWKQLGIDRSDARNLYLAYHEGRGGYARGTWKKKKAVRDTAEKVTRTATQYRTQLERCEAQFRCDAWYQVWPFCR